MGIINLELPEGRKEPYSIIVTPGTYAIAYWSVTAGSARVGDDFTVDRDRGIAVKVTEAAPVYINFNIVDDRIAEEREFFKFDVEFEAFDVITGDNVASLNDNYTIVIIDNDAACFIDLNRDGKKSGVDLTFDQIYRLYAKEKHYLDNANAKLKIAAEKLDNLLDQKYLIKQLIITEVLDTSLSFASLGISSFGKILARDLPAFIEQLAAIIQPLPGTLRSPQPSDFQNGGPAIDAIKGLLGLASAFTKIAPIIGLTIDTYQRVSKIEEITLETTRIVDSIKSANTDIADLRNKIEIVNKDLDNLTSCLQGASALRAQNAFVPMDVGLYRSENEIVVQALGLKMTNGTSGADQISVIQGFFEVFTNRLVIAGAGNDVVSVSPSLLSPMLLIVAGGEGYDTLNIEGNSADYQWHITQEGTVALTPYTDVQISVAADPFGGAFREGFATTRPSDGWRILLDQVEAIRFTDRAFTIISQRIDGTDGNDRLVGRNLGERLFGALGNDTLVGLRGADTFVGGPGNDILIGDGPLSFTTAAASIRRLYIATLDRAPDDSGWQGWATAREGGQALTDIAGGFVGSTEFQAKYGTLSNTDFVRTLYRNVLDREADQAGLDANVNALNSDALTRTQIVVNFSESGEFAAGTTPSLHAGQIYRLYGATLARAPDAGGFEGWTDAMSGGRGLVDIAAGFVGSGEFQTRYGALNNTDFVTLLYQNVLGRAPDAGGLAGWKSALDSGAQTRTQVVTGFSESGEYINGTRAATDAFMRNVMSAWSDTLVGGQGDDKLTGGRGSDRFVFAASEGGNDTIYGFESFDTLELNGFGFANATAALSAMSQQGANVVLAYTGGSITFEATQLSVLQSMTAQGWVFG